MRGIFSIIKPSGCGLLVAILSACSAAATVVVTPTENPIGLKNPLKGIRGRSGGQLGDYGTMSTERDNTRWGQLETRESDGIDVIRARCDNIWKDYPARNIKVVARVMVNCPGCGGCVVPSDVPCDENSPIYQARALRLIERLGIVWDNDPRVGIIETGFCGNWSEGTCGGSFGVKVRDAFTKAFKNKKWTSSAVGRDYEPSTVGGQWDSFAHPDQTAEPDMWLNLKNPDGTPRWKISPMEGEVAYDWGGVASVLGSNLSTSLSTPAYYNRLVNFAYILHASVEGSSGGATVTASTGADLYQKALGYRFILDTLTYPSSAQTGQSFSVSFAVRNVGSCPFYYPWPVQLALLNKTSHAVVWTGIFDATDIRKWLPGSDWNVPNRDAATLTTLAGRAYRTPALRYHETGSFTIPSSVPSGEYVLALAVLDRDGGMLPNLRFAINNYWQGGYHPMGIIGVGSEPASTAIDASTFFAGRNDATLHYIVPSSPVGIMDKGGRPSAVGSSAPELRVLPHALIAVPAGPFSLRVVNASGAVVLRQTGAGPRTCDLSPVGSGMHFVIVTSGATTVSRAFLNVK